MPIKHTGTHSCDYCHSPFEWNHFEMIRNHISDATFFVDSKPENKCYTVDFIPKSNGTYHVVVMCPKCKKENDFIYVHE